MPPRPQSEAETHQAAQAVLVTGIAGAVAESAWPQFDPKRINDTMPRLVILVMGLIHKFGLASSVHAAHYYQDARKAAGVPGRFQVPMPPLPPVSKVEAELRWAVNDLYGATTPVGVRPGESASGGFVAGAPGPKAKVAPPPTPGDFEVDPEAVAAALEKVQAVTERLVLDQSRSTIIDAVLKDPKALGWARVPEAGACSFCLLLATRGAVYKTKETAGPNKRGRRNARAGLAFTGSGEFKVHDNCQCHVEPNFSLDYEPTALVRAAQKLYANTPYGSSPQEARNNFRVALQRERDAGRI